MSRFPQFRSPALWYLVAAVSFLSLLVLGLSVWLPYQRTQQFIRQVEAVGGHVSASSTLPNWMGNVWTPFGVIEWIWLFETRVSFVELSECPIDDVWLSRLRAFPSIYSLKLNHTKITDAGLLHVSTLQNLGHLDLGHTSVTDKGIRHLSGLSKLTYLVLANTKVTGSGLSALHCPIDQLVLDGSRFNDAGMAELHRFPLQWIGLSETDITDVGMTKLTACPDIAFLTLGKTKLTDASLDAVARFPKLEELYLDELPVSDAGIAKLAGARNLKHLNLVATRVTGHGLSGFRSLEHLNLSKTSIDDEGLRCLPPCERLKLDKTGITDDGIRFLVTAHRHQGLVNLAVRSTKVTDRALKLVSVLPRLDSISLKDTACTEQAIFQFLKLRDDLALPTDVKFRY